jgi:hypothetical protein
MDFKELRKQLIILDNTTEMLYPSDEMMLVQMYIKEASMLSGKMLGALGISPSPYINDGNRVGTKDIEPKVDDTQETLPPTTISKGTVGIVDTMREMLKKQFEELVEWELHAVRGDVDNYERDLILNNISSRLVLARLWLGAELGRIRKEAVGD